MDTNFYELLIIQEKVNSVILDKAKRKPYPIDFMFAGYVEMFEFLNQIGTWKWWKHSHNLNREKILDELADIIAFFLCFILSYEDYPKIKVDEIIQDYLKSFEGFSVDSILKNITIAINDGHGQPAALIMAECLYVAKESIDITWEDVSEAYVKKSQENIDRQKRNY